jgi:hypothetical protein
MAGARCNSPVLEGFGEWVVVMCEPTAETVVVEPSAEIVDEAKEEYEAVGPDGDRREMMVEYVLDRVELEVRLGTE